MANRKKVYEEQGKGHVVKVHWDSEWREYRVTMDGRQDESVYFTTDKEDAIESASAWMNRQLAQDEARGATK